MSNARGYLYEGDLYFARIVGGVEQAMQGPFEGSRLAMQMNVDRVDMLSRGKNRTGQVLESVAIPQPAGFSITLNEGTPDVVALGLMGTVSAIAQTSGTWTAEAFTVTALDSWLPLAKSSLATSQVVKDVTDTTTYVEGTDYELNRDLGWIRVLSTGSISLSDVLHLTGAFNAHAGSRIAGGTSPDLRIKLVLDGRNMADGARCKVTVKEGILSAEDAVDFLSGQFLNTPLAGRMKTPTGETSPFDVDMLDAA